jgi:hypothetical protein
MKVFNDPRKRPLLTPEQLRVIRQGLRGTDSAGQLKRKASPREEFENLFRLADQMPLIANG